MNLPAGPYDLLLADPPWRYHYWSDKGRFGSERSAGYSPDMHYPTLTDEELEALDVGSAAARNAVLLLWTTRLKLPTALRLIERWGFEYRSMAFTWVKLNQDGSPYLGLGRYTRANTEYCLLAARGDGVRVRGRDVAEVILSRRREHSRKPDGQYDRIARLFGTEIRRLELFARRRWPGWDAWGLEAPAEELLMLPLEAAG